MVRLAAGRVFRVLDDATWADFLVLQKSGTLKRLIESGRVVDTTVVNASDAPAGLTQGGVWHEDHVLEHEPIPFISYPYEWPFSLLKRAALHHLDLHLDLIDAGFDLCDASAYNVQFRGPRPVFIDIPSIRPYHEGDYWIGHRQFCEQFLNPLLLTAVVGVPHQAWLRGSMDGIPIEEMSRVLPLRARMSWRVWMHVLLHARMTAKARHTHRAQDTAPARRRPMSKPGFTWMLGGMRTWIRGLEPPASVGGTWTDYTTQTSYEAAEASAKRAFVCRYVAERRPTEVFDLGCNDGYYSQAALEAGARRVIGFDFDRGALEAAVKRADDHSLNFLPLFLDAMNPSADQGWAQRERRGFQSRARPDGLLALAFLHHLVIGRNVPMSQAVTWLVALAPSGIIEFTPKDDPKVQLMLMHRHDVFPGYGIDAFRRDLSGCAAIVREERVSNSGRTLFEYRR